MRLNAEGDLVVVGETGDGREAMQLVRVLQSDVILTNIQLLGMDGIALAERLRRDFPDCAVVVLNL
ncbi:MAG: DNA-binding response regulator [Chloroflexi bacterium]|nr:MAG: DNA-binding response regulator [Chloroflexota bacterium]